MPSVLPYIVAVSRCPVQADATRFVTTLAVKTELATVAKCKRDTFIEIRFIES